MSCPVGFAQSSSSCTLNPGTESDSGDHYGTRQWEEILPEAPQAFRNLPSSLGLRKMATGITDPVLMHAKCGDWADTSDSSRHGELEVKNSSGVEYKFNIVADHAFSIHDGQYTLNRRPSSDELQDQTSNLLGYRENRTE